MPLRPTPLAAVLAATSVFFAAGPAQAFTLHVLHFNDFHSRIESINAFDSTCSAEDEGEGECFGGAARLVTAVNGQRDEIRAAGGNVWCSRQATCSRGRCSSPPTPARSRPRC